MTKFSRKVIAQLTNWSASEYRKPLVFRGARQVGKTTAVQIFSKEFDRHIYLNLERFEDASLFTRNLSPEKLIESIFLFKNISGSPGKRTLLFIDEIRNSPQAMAHVRFFYESAKQLQVIAAGSLLESVMEPDNCLRTRVDFPVALGPNRKKDFSPNKFFRSIMRLISIRYPDEYPGPRPRWALEDTTFYEEFGKRWGEFKRFSSWVGTASSGGPTPQPSSRQPT